MIHTLCMGVQLAAFLFTFFSSGTRYILGTLIGATVATVAALGMGFYFVWDESINSYFFADHFVSDPTSRMFLVLITAVMVGFTPYVINRTLTNQMTAQGIAGFVRLTLVFFILSVAAIFSNHLIIMWLALEATAVMVVPLIFHQRGDDSFRAAWRYLIFSTAGLTLTFLGIVLFMYAVHEQHAEQSVSFLFHEFAGLNLQRSVWTDLAMFFTIVGLGTKLGLAPMYTWLPETYDAAPPSVTALLASVQFNCGVAMLFRLIPVFRQIDAPLLNHLLIFIGLLSIVVSSIHIVLTRNYKRLISYASINHAGVIALGLGVGKSASYGVVLYVLSNTLVKAILFFTAGNIKARFGTKNMQDIQGLIKDMPYSGWFFMIGIFALLGFAPFGSFIGEIMIMSSLIEIDAWLVFIALCILIVVTFVATGRSVFPMIWGTPKLDSHQRGESIYTLLPNLMYFVMLLSLGIYIPPMGNEIIIKVANTLGGQ